MQNEFQDPTAPAYLSIIVPILNESDQLPGLLEHLQRWQQRGCQIILVDGGSWDSSVELAGKADFPVITGPEGRARQMNTGAKIADGEILLFLHADTRLPDNANLLIGDALNGDSAPLEDRNETLPQWGRFDVTISGDSFLLKVVGWLMNQRSRLTGIATGDQAMFVNSRTFQRVGGFPDQPLMEDIELCKTLRRISRPASLKQKVTTSGRRWESKGVCTTIWLMWRLRFAYWRGVPTAILAQRYR